MLHLIQNILFHFFEAALLPVAFGFFSGDFCYDLKVQCLAFHPSAPSGVRKMLFPFGLVRVLKFLRICRKVRKTSLPVTAGVSVKHRVPYCTAPSDNPYRR